MMSEKWQYNLVHEVETINGHSISPRMSRGVKIRNSNMSLILSEHQVEVIYGLLKYPKINVSSDSSNYFPKINYCRWKDVPQITEEGHYN